MGPSIEWDPVRLTDECPTKAVARLFGSPLCAQHLGRGLWPSRCLIPGCSVNEGRMSGSGMDAQGGVGRSCLSLLLSPSAVEVGTRGQMKEACRALSGHGSGLASKAPLQSQGSTGLG